ncbi:MAG: hypothetical protein WC734_06190 [Patescibacteria group bacterium]
MDNRQKPVTVNFSLERKIGADNVRIAVSSYAEPGNDGLEFNRIMSVAADAMNDFVNNIFVTLPRDESAVSGDGWYIVTQLNVTIDKGKRYVKALCGDWNEFGLVIWPELAARKHIDLDIVPVTGYKPKTMEVKVSVTNGKPRVIDIRVGAGESAGNGTR